MAMMICSECTKEFSDTIKKCPHCGFKRPKQVGMMGAIFAVAVALMIFSCMRSQAERDNIPKPVKTPEQIAAEEKKEAAFQKTVTFIKAVKSSARNPDSIKFESIVANDDASVICVEYRGQNGFGGMSKEYAVFANSKISQKPEAWNKHCTKTVLNNMDHATRAL